ncbi:unnamed protein product [Peronospora belbahrii]|uniref:Cap-specific mRNA (nucleoside-2'-O-)-methyltransferase 1 n=1 Tax=Peronospora belbahrii TaxID=622444 RepID=A0AAU9L6Q6_9STRA|nr:unnamed protein product [Peronospora belbahrii]CAH0519240.1 unnamed protein product [Peronospora belbahrii]
MSGDDEMMTAMGFTSFGQRHCDRSRVKQVASKKTNVYALPQLIPGTELVAELSMESVQDGPHGVVFLVCKDVGSYENGLIEVLDEDIKKSAEWSDKEEQLVPYLPVLKKLNREKCKFDEVNSLQFTNARSATNPFETLGRHRFLNRSAMKLVTLDYMFQWTQRLEQHQESLSFADICGGPGGFSEYLLWRANCATKGNGDLDQCIHGYGITLKEAANKCDWRLPSTSRNLFTICYGEDGTGNLCTLANIHRFRDVVRVRHPSGVDLVLADGGCLHARSQSNQELVMTRLISAEVLAMFSVLSVGGDFVCKTFELTTPAMLQLCWLLHRCFERFAVVKPITSRPASSERYIVARGLQASRSIPKLVKILEDRLVQSSCNNTSDDNQLTFLPNSTPMREDMDFHKYMTAANKAIAMSQIQACRCINEFLANKNKRKSRGDDPKIDRNQYYQCWQLGINSRQDVAQ